MQTVFNPVYYDCYKERPQTRFTLESAYQADSKTRQFPFVIASELSTVDETDERKVTIEPVNIFDLIKQCGNPQIPPKDKEELTITLKQPEINGEIKREGPTRQFLIFHDIEHYINWKEHYPNCHEVIRCPSYYNNSDDGGFKEDKEDLCRGRLIFDFDCKTALNCLSPQEKKQGLYVPSIFKALIEHLILSVFKNYYIDVDCSKFLFVWQITKYDHKFSMHLIVKNAYFNEYWITQMRIFYELMSRTAKQMEDIVYFAENNGINERITVNPYYVLSKTLDFQIPRKNATFRILGCSKIGGLPLEIDCCNNNGIDLLTNPNFKLTIYDCLVGIYHVEHLREEQQISMVNLNYVSIQDEIEESMDCEQTKEEKRFQYVINNNVSLMRAGAISEINFDDKDIAKSVELFESWNDDGSFTIRDQIGDCINLNRVKASPCKISGHVHDRENGYLKMRTDGKLHFHCRRGCNNKGKYSIEIGFYKNQKRPEGIVPINLTKFNQVKNLKMNIKAMPDVVCSNHQTYKPGKEYKTNCKKVQVGFVSVVQVPPFMRVK